MYDHELVVVIRFEDAGDCWGMSSNPKCLKKLALPGSHVVAARKWPGAILVTRNEGRPQRTSKFYITLCLNQWWHQRQSCHMTPALLGAEYDREYREFLESLEHLLPTLPVPQPIYQPRLIRQKFWSNEIRRGRTKITKSPAVSCKYHLLKWFNCF